MEAIKNRYILPIMPPSQNELQTIYPWESVNILNDIIELYKLVIKTGFKGSFEDFKEKLGAIIEQRAIIINAEEYMGAYTVTPLPIMTQILRTENKVLRENIVVEPIPYYETSNTAGGCTVIIG